MIQRNEEHYQKIRDYYKQVKIFISSTFLDMNGERDYILREVAPRLLEWGKLIGIDFTFVDLRWGISKDSSMQGRTLPLCLNAVDESIPFVIAFLGDRTGWVPKREELSHSVCELIDHPEKYEELNYSDGIRKSIEIMCNGLGKQTATEMEIQRALLGDKKENISFFIRENDNNNMSSNLKRIAQAYGYTKYVGRKYRDDYYVDFMVNGDISLSEYIINRVKEMCKEYYPKKVDQSIPDVEKRFNQNCYLYGKNVYTYVEKGDETEILRNFIKSGKKVLYIDGPNNSGKKSLASYLLSIMIENRPSWYYSNWRLSIDVAFSYDIMNRNDLMSQLEMMRKDEKNIGPIEFDNEKSMPLFIVAKGLTSELWDYILDNPFIYLITYKNADHYLVKNENNCRFVIQNEQDKLLDKNDVMISQIITTDFDDDRIERTIEIYLKKFSKSISDTQMSELKTCSELHNKSRLFAFLNKIINTASFGEVDRLIDEIINRNGNGDYEINEMLRKISFAEYVAKRDNKYAEYVYENINKIKDLDKQAFNYFVQDSDADKSMEMLDEAYKINDEMSPYRIEKDVLSRIRVATIINMHRVFVQRLICRRYYLEHQTSICSNEDNEEKMEFNRRIKYLDSLYYMFPIEDAAFLNGSDCFSFFDGSVIRDYSKLEYYRQLLYRNRVEYLLNGLYMEIKDFFKYGLALSLSLHETEQMKMTAKATVVEEGDIPIFARCKFEYKWVFLDYCTMMIQAF